MNNFDRAMQGFNFGVNAVRQYQDIKLEKDAGAAYKNTGQETGTTSDFGKVEQEGLYSGPGNDGAMTNAEAASYGLMQPQSTKTDYTLAGKTQGTAFTEGQVEAARTRASADVYANAGRMREASGLRRDAAQLGLTELQMQGAQRAENVAAEGDVFRTTMQGYAKEFGAIGLDAEGKPLAPDAALTSRAGSWQKMRAAALANPVAAKDWLPTIEAAKQQSLSAHLQTITPGVDATNDQVITYIKGAAKANAQFGDVMAPDQLYAARQTIDKMNKEGFTNALEAAQRGDTTEAMRLWNSAGTMKGKLVSLTPAKMSEQYGGLASFVATYEGSDGSKHTINVGDTLANAQTLKERVDMTTKIQEGKDRTRSTDATVRNAGTAAAAQGVAAKVADSTIAHNKVQTEKERNVLDTKKALGTPVSEQTPEQKVLVAAANREADLKRNSKTNFVAVRKAVEKTINDYIVGGKTFTTPYMKDEVEKGAVLRRISGKIMGGMNVDDLESSSILDMSQEVIKRANGLKETGFKGTLEEAALEVMKQEATPAAPLPAAAGGMKPPAAARPTPAAAQGTSGYGHLWNNRQ
jgi:hypothetical protein